MPPSGNPSGSRPVFPHKRPRVRAVRVKDELVLIAPETSLRAEPKLKNRALVLNSSGRAIWDLCDGKRTIEDIVGALESRFSSDRKSLSRQVRGTLSDMSKAGFLEKLARPSREADCSLDESTAGRPDPDAGVESCAIGFLDGAVNVATDCDRTAKALRKLFERTAATPDLPSLAEMQISVSDDKAKLVGDGRTLATGRLGPKFFREVYRKAVERFIDRHSGLLWLHAGCAASGGAVVMPGAWGHGKSSLVVELYRHGWSFLSDDVTPIEAGGGMVIPFPVTPQIRVPTTQELPREKLGSVPKEAVTIDPDRIASAPVPLSMIVLPRYASKAATQLSPVSPARAVAALLENCLNFACDEDSMIRHACALVDAYPVYDLLFSDVADAAESLIDTHAEIVRSVRRKSEKENSGETGVVSSARPVDVEIVLTGGVRHSLVLPSDSPLLAELFEALARGARPDDRSHTLLQLPVGGGRTALSFMSSSLISVITTPAVLISSKPELETEAPTFVQIDDFLTKAENRRLLDYALQHESEFSDSGVTTKADDYRRSRVLYTISDSKWRDIFVSRLMRHLPDIRSTLELPDFQIAKTEIQLTASGDGDFFRAHPDGGGSNEATSSREVTFVYYLHRRPKPFSGGNLLIYRDEPDHDGSDKDNGVCKITPKNNSLVAFASTRWHEVKTVHCSSGKFADSRFTVNGWLHRQ